MATAITQVLATGTARARSSASTAGSKGGLNHSILLNEGEEVEDKNAGSA